MSGLTPSPTPKLEVAPFQRRWAELTLLVGILTATIVLRLLRARFLDGFEDGYQNWWISGNLVLTGHYWDPYSGMTRGNWLPAYHFIGAGVLGAFGIDSMIGLKALNAAFSAGTAFVVYLLARDRGMAHGLLAASLLATSAFEISTSALALPESLALLTVFSAYYVYLRKPFGPSRSLVVASAGFALGAALRYEVWGFLVLLLGYGLASDRTKWKTTLWVLTPAVVFGIGWWIWTSQWGFFPATIVTQTSTDPAYKASLGALPSAPASLVTFLSWYWAWSPFSLVAIAWAVLRDRRAFLSVVLFAFYAAEVVWVFIRFGNPGPRYLHLTIPVVCLYSSRAFLTAAAYIPRRFTLSVHAGRAWAAGAVAAALVLGATLGAAVANPNRNPGFLLEGMQRAGLYLSTLNIPEDKFLLSESPVAAYYSQVPPSRIIGSALLPNNATAVEDLIRKTVAYVVYVTVPYYKLRILFPDQANGVNNNFLQLLYDATGSEYDFGAPRVLVFRVLP